MRFFEKGLRTEVEERLGLIKNFRTSPSLVVFWVVIPDHQAAYSPFLVRVQQGWSAGTIKLSKYQPVQADGQ